MRNFEEIAYAFKAHDRFGQKDPDVADGELLRKTSVILCTPTFGSINWRVVQAWEALRWPMNCQRNRLWIQQREVGKAYEAMIRDILEEPMLRDRMFILTMEDDNIPQRDAFIKLVEGIYTCIDCGKTIDWKTWTCPDGHKGLDGIAGVYFTKADDIPLVFGDPSDPDDCTTLDIRRAYKEGKIVECNVIPNGFSLFRLGMIKQMSEPRFLTLDGGKGYHSTQDVYFCKKAKKETGARFAAHCGVKVGHYDINTGEIY